jgi:hypothetical protein
VHLKRIIEAGVLGAGGCILLFSAIAMAQQRGGNQTRSPAYLRPELFDDSFSAQIVALGTRVQRPGMERLTMTGILTGRNGQNSVTAAWEVPNRLRLEHAGSARKTIGFDGSVAWSSEGQVAEEDLAVIESLSSDSAEGFLSAVLQGAAPRILGRRFREDDGRTPNYKGPWHDIYQIAVPSAHDGRKLIQKMFYFDSTTAQIAKVRYKSASEVQVETRWTGWQVINGQPVPGLVTRTEGGRTVLEFHGTGASLTPYAPDNLFSSTVIAR